jgi:alpha-glucosidase
MHTTTPVCTRQPAPARPGSRRFPTLHAATFRLTLALGLLAAGLAWQPARAADPAPARGELVAGPSAPVARFTAPSFTVADALASFALTHVPAPAGPLPDGFRVRPVIDTDAQGLHRVRVAIEPGTSLYGTGEVTGPLLRNGREVILWNSDNPGYGPEVKSLYQSHPWVLALRADGSAFGVLVDTTWRTTIRLDGAIEFLSEGASPRVYVIDRPDVAGVLSALRELTGPMPMPPRWALGYQQCRWSYFPESRVREVAREFRTRDIPADVLWFDIDYMDAYRTFTFSPEHFPDPAKLNADLGAQGWKRVWMINPGVKDEAGYFVRDQLVEGGHAVQTPEGRPFRGDVWPGPCLFPDFTSPAARAWWGTLYRDFLARGVDGVWNDMNEPAVFSTPTKLMPVEMRHAGGEYVSLPGQPPQTVSPGDHARFHNVYGMLMAQASYEGILAARPDKRPFVLTRASFLGGHRYAATWTGDNTANWNDLEQSIPMVLNLGLSGQPFVGPDLGGFNSNGPRDARERADQFARWFGIGTLFPFARGHTARGNIDKEPWSFGPDTETACRLAIQRRYRLLPYIYTLFEEAHRTGMPVMRPAFMADPTDQALRSEDDVFLLGGDVLVKPQLMPDRTRQPILPRGAWRSVELAPATHPALPELFLRAGAIVPVGPLMEFSDEYPLDPLTLIVSLDAQGQASGWLYEDAGDGFTYRHGDFLRTRFVARRVDQSVIVQVGERQGQRPPFKGRSLVVRVLTDHGVFEARGGEDKPIMVPLK